MRQILLPLATVLLVAGCSTLDAELPQDSSFTVRLSAESPATRTANSGNSTVWESGDAVNVFHALSGSTSYLSDGAFTVSDTSEGSFSGKLAETLAPGGSYDWYFVYPYNSLSNSPGAAICTIGSTSDTPLLAGECFPLAGKVSGIQEGSTPSVKLSQLASVLAVTVTNSGSSAFSVNGISFTAPQTVCGSFKVDITGDSPVYTDYGSCSKTASLNVSSSSSLAAGANATFYLGIKPFSASSGESLTLSISTSSGSFEKSLTLSEAVSFGAGCIKPVAVSCDASSISIHEPYSQSSGTVSVNGITYKSTSSDENAVKVSGGSFTMTDCTLLKTDGKTTNSDGSSFYGTNAALLSTGSGTVTMNGGSITTGTSGANGVVAYKGTVVISDVTINCSSNLSRGIHATGGGSITASNLTITTSGNNSSLIATDRGGGTVSVTGGSYKTTGGSSAIIYSTGDISATGITGSSSQGSMCVIEGDNSITVSDSELTSGGSSRGILILQSGSGDATGYNGVVNISNSTLTYTTDGKPFIEVATTMKGTVNLTDVTISNKSGILLRADYNTRWKTKNPVAILNLLTTRNSWSYSGDIEADSYGTATVNVGKGVTWTGAFDSANTGKSTALTVASGGTWILSADSYVDSVTIESGGSVVTNGHTLSYSSISNKGTLN